MEGLPMLGDSRYWVLRMLVVSRFKMIFDSVRQNVSFSYFLPFLLSSLSLLVDDQRC